MFDPGRQILRVEHLPAIIHRSPFLFHLIAIFNVFGTSVVPTPYCGKRDNLHRGPNRVIVGGFCEDLQFPVGGKPFGNGEAGRRFAASGWGGLALLLFPRPVVDDVAVRDGQ